MDFLAMQNFGKPGEARLRWGAAGAANHIVGPAFNQLTRHPAAVQNARGVQGVQNKRASLYWCFAN